MSVDEKPLARRLREVIELACLGRSDGEIASELGIGKQTVETHWKRLRKRYDTSSRVVVVSRYLQAKHDQEVNELRKSLVGISASGNDGLKVNEDGVVDNVHPDSEFENLDQKPSLKEIDEAAHELQSLKRELANLKEACENLGLTLFKAEPFPPFRVKFISGPIDKELGFASSEFEYGQRRFGSTVRPDDAYEVNQHVLKAMENGDDHWETCYRAVDANGNELVRFDFNVLKRDEEGKPKWIYGLTTPLRERLKPDSQAIQFLNRMRQGKGS